jgi:hypothetical protein
LKFTIRNVFETDVDTFWNRVFFDDEYNRRLYMDALAFKRFEVLSQTGGPGETRTRTMVTEPKTEAPAVVQKLVGGSFSYTEQGSWDPRTKIWTYAITTSKLSDKVKVGGRYWCEPLGDKRLERVCEIELEVKVFGVGGVIEQFMEKTTRESYEDTTRFTNAFIREKGL